MDQLFYVLSLKYSNGAYWVWWGPDRRGYVNGLESAGKYTEADVRHHDLNNNTTTRAIPCATVDGMKTSTVLLMRHEDFIAMKAASVAVIGEPRPTEHVGGPYP